MHHPKKQAGRDEAKWKSGRENQRKEAAIANTTGVRTLAAITAAVPVRLMRRDLLFLAEQFVSLLDENRLAVVAKQHGIKKAKDSDSLGKLFSAYLRRAEEGLLGKVLVETTILYMATRHNASQVLRDAAAIYKVDTDAIALKVKQGSYALSFNPFGIGFVADLLMGHGMSLPSDRLILSYARLPTLDDRSRSRESVMICPPDGHPTSFQGQDISS